MSALPPDRLVSGFYLNELLLKLFARHDSHPDVFALYGATLDALKADVDGHQWILFVAGHSARHTAQLNEVKTAPGYPGK